MKDELKNSLKPLIKQCIKEVIFEDGVLSGIITEVVRGLDTRSMVVESQAMEPENQTEYKQSLREQERAAFVESQRAEHRREMEAQRRNLTETVGKRFNGIDLFEGTTPISKAGSPPNPGSAVAPSSALDGVDPNDPGVDISKLGIF
jgi:hypothetical protein